MDAPWDPTGWWDLDGLLLGGRLSWALDAARRLGVARVTIARAP